MSWCQPLEIHFNPRRIFVGKQESALKGTSVFKNPRFSISTPKQKQNQFLHFFFDGDSEDGGGGGGDDVVNSEISIVDSTRPLDI